MQTLSAYFSTTDDSDLPYLFDLPPWALIKFLDLESAGWALIRGGRLFEAGRFLNFHHFQQVKYVYFAKKQ